MKQTYSTLRYVAVMSIVYIALVFLLPANRIAQHIYDLTAAEYHFQLLIVVLPLILVWLIAFYGYSKMVEYAKVIHKTPEGNDFGLIAKGVRWVAWSLPVPSIVSIILNSVANSYPNFHPSDIIITDYLTLFFALIAFNYISRGSHHLSVRSKVAVSLNGARFLITFFVIIGVILCFFTFRHLDLNNIGDSDNTLFLPTWLATISLIVPYLCIWFIGLLAAAEILLVARHTRGILYRKGLQALVLGIVLIIASFTAIQYYRSIVPRTGHLSLGVTLVVTYIFQIGIASGFLFLAYGANHLKRIEEV